MENNIQCPVCKNKLSLETAVKTDDLLICKECGYHLFNGQEVSTIGVMIIQKKNHNAALMLPIKNIEEYSSIVDSYSSNTKSLVLWIYKQVEGDNIKETNILNLYE